VPLSPKTFPEYEVVELDAAAPAFYHLDIGFFPLNNETIFYYPEAYTREESKKTKKNSTQSYFTY